MVRGCLSGVSSGAFNRGGCRVVGVLPAGWQAAGGCRLRASMGLPVPREMKILHFVGFPALEIPHFVGNAALEIAHFVGNTAVKILHFVDNGTKLVLHFGGYPVKTPGR